MESIIKKEDYVKCIDKNSDFKDYIGIVEEVGNVICKVKICNKLEAFDISSVKKITLNVSNYKINDFSITCGFQGKSHQNITLEEALEIYKEHFYQKLLNVINLNYVEGDNEVTIPLLRTKEDKDGFNHPEIVQDYLKTELQFLIEMDDIMIIIRKWKHANNIF